MSYPYNVTVARFTREDLRTFDRMFPGVSKTVTIPLVDTIEEAEKHARIIVQKKLNRFERIESIRLRVEEDASWFFTCNISTNNN